MTVEFFKPFRERRTAMCGRTEIRGWKVKVYGMVGDVAELDENTVKAGIGFAESEVPWPDDVADKYGFLTLHVGEEAVWLLVDIWASDILRHFLFSAPIDAPTEFSAAPTDGTMACVWEMQVLWHERQAWVKHVMAKPEAPDFDGYMNDSLDISAPD